MNNHTPGPWHVGMRQAERIVYDAKGNAVANATVFHGYHDDETVKANALLIAEAGTVATETGYGPRQLFNKLRLCEQVGVDLTEYSVKLAEQRAELVKIIKDFTDHFSDGKQGQLGNGFAYRWCDQARAILAKCGKVGG